MDDFSLDEDSSSEEQDTHQDQNDIDKTATSTRVRKRKHSPTSAQKTFQHVREQLCLVQTEMSKRCVSDITGRARLYESPQNTYSETKGTTPTQSIMNTFASMFGAMSSNLSGSRQSGRPERTPNRRHGRQSLPDSQIDGSSSNCQSSHTGNTCNVVDVFKDTIHKVNESTENSTTPKVDEKFEQVLEGTTLFVRMVSQATGNQKAGECIEHNLRSFKSFTRELSKFVHTENSPASDSDELTSAKPDPVALIKAFAVNIKEKCHKNVSPKYFLTDEQPLDLYIDLNCDVPSTRKIATELYDDIVKLMADEVLFNNYNMAKNDIASLTGITDFMGSGSTADGFSTPRWFVSDPVYEFEIDVMYIIGVLGTNIQPFIKPIKGDNKEVFICLTYQDGVYEQCFNEDFLCENEINSLIFEKKCISAQKFREQAVKFLKGRKRKDDDGEETSLLTVFLEVMSDNDGQTFQVVEKPCETLGDVASTVTCTSRINKDICAISIDHVVAMQLNFLPSWLKFRLSDLSSWLTGEQIKELLRTFCHIVPKSSKDGHPHEEWRYSFSSIEKKLMDFFSESQRVCYYLFKAIFYKYIKPSGQYEETKPDGQTEVKCVFHSYIIKTVMFWVCDKHPPSHEIWQQRNLFAAVHLLLETMEDMLDQREPRVPHFFMPGYNLVQDIHSKYLHQTVQKLHEIKSNVLLYIPFNIKEVRGRLEDPIFIGVLHWLLHIAVLYCYT